MRRVLIFIILLMFSMAGAADRTNYVNVGVRAFNGAQSAYDKWMPTIKYLNDHQNGYIFRLVPVYGFDQMRELVQNKEISFVITQPAEAVMLHEKYGMNIFLTLLNSYKSQTFSYFSAAIFTRADRKDINSLGDLKGKNFAAIDPDGFGAYWMGLRELRRAGLHENKDFNVTFTGTQNKIVENVLNKEADFGSVRTGILEKLAMTGKINLKDIKVLHPVHDGLPLLHSTDIYPEWAFEAGGDVEQSLVQTVQQILINIPPDSEMLKQSMYGGWILPVNYAPVYDMMKDMKVGLYAEEPVFTLVGIPFYSKVLIPVCLLWLGLILFVLYRVFKK